MQTVMQLNNKGACRPSLGVADDMITRVDGLVEARAAPASPAPHPLLTHLQQRLGLRSSVLARSRLRLAAIPLTTMLEIQLSPHRAPPHLSTPQPLIKLSDVREFAWFVFLPGQEMEPPATENEPKAGGKWEFDGRQNYISTLITPKFIGKCICEWRMILGKFLMLVPGHVMI